MVEQGMTVLGAVMLIAGAVVLVFTEMVAVDVQPVMVLVTMAVYVPALVTGKGLVLVVLVGVPGTCQVNMVLDVVEAAVS